MELGSEGVFQPHVESPSCRESEPGEKARVREWDLNDEAAIGEDDELVHDRSAFTTAVKCLKIVVYVVTFCLVLGGGVISKATALFMTSVIGKDRRFAPGNITGIEMDQRFVIRLSTEERHIWTWCLLFALVVPETLTFFRSVQMCVFKQYRRPKTTTFLVVLAAESLHTLGLVLLVFSAFTKLNALTAASLASAACLVPSFLGVLSGWSRNPSAKDWLKNILNLAALAGQASVFVLAGTRADSAATVVGAVLVSFAWWENFTGKTLLAGLKEDIEKSRNFVYVFVSIWKMFLIFASCFAFVVFFNEDDVKGFLSALPRSFEGRHHNLTITWPLKEWIPSELRPEDRILEGYRSSHPLLPFMVAALHAASSYLCYFFGKFACRVCIQGFGLALPALLAAPATLGLLGTACSKRGEFRDVLPVVFWACPGEEDAAFFGDELGWLWVVWLASQAWVTVHVWFPRCERMASTHKLFVNPMYCTVLIDQSMTLNRRKDEVTDVSDKKNDKKPSLGRDERSYPPMIFACATMWHETLDEMEQLLKSIMRLDYHQCQQEIINNSIKNPDYYRMEAHIFFDDAFVVSDRDDDKMTINSFVKDLVVAVNTAAGKVYKDFEELGPPIKVPTPYGGRLIWVLHGENTLNVHLKNKELIRHKKRWSQVMYMYYLLGYHLRNCYEEDNLQMEDCYANTFILALDGDIDFKPDAVQLLVDLMHRNRGLGAACGRIHPVGTGLMVSYQKFEYAIGHWLQKATEHMIGCVLCSPGCFSLFRAEALVRNNTVRRYASKSREAVEYVQFDQGEDRWLCTLLLQRGYRVEYSAASDAYTHCPESFAEFYTQRRRWGPSTLANIADLLSNYKATVECNDNISRPYIAYQVLLMLGTILGPGTIFLMLVGAMVTAFGISNWHSFAANIVPIIFFIIICFQAKNDMQIFIAQVLSALYALLMMAVLVSITLQMVEDGLSSPSALFVMSMAASFVAAALLHPQEAACVLHGLLYFLSVPSMYLLLALYSFVNLHVVSWGTREVAVKKSRRQMQEEAAAAVAAAQKPTASKGGMRDWMNILNDKNSQADEGGMSFNLANLFKCMCFTHPKPDPSALHMANIEAHMRDISGQVTTMKKQMDSAANRAGGYRRRSFPHGNQNDSFLNAVAEDEVNEEDVVDVSQTNMDEEEEEDDSEENDDETEEQGEQHWMSEECLEGSRVWLIQEEEETFWRDMIKTYLEPLNDDPDEKAKVSRQLLDLRNNVVFGVLMLNALFVLVVFLLQMKKDDLHVEWPLNGKANITYLPEFREIRIEMSYLHLEPINLVLVFFFTLILIIQFLGMILHRFQTFSHILSSTEILEPKTVDDKKLVVSKVNDQLLRMRLKEDERRPAKEDDASAAEVPLVEERVQTKGKQKLKSLAFAIEMDLLNIMEKDNKLAFEVRRMSKTPDVLDALKRRTSCYNMGLVESSRPTRTPSMRSKLAVLDREFGSSRGTPSVARQAHINQGFIPDDSFDTESVDSIEITDLRPTDGDSTSISNIRNPTSGSGTKASSSCVDLRKSLAGNGKHLGSPASERSVNFRNTASGSNTSLRNTSDESRTNLRNIPTGNKSNWANSASRSFTNMRNPGSGSSTKLRNTAFGSSASLRNVSVNLDLIRNSVGGSQVSLKKSSYGSNLTSVNASDINLRSSVIDLKKTSIRRGSVDLRRPHIRNEGAHNGQHSISSVNPAHLHRKLKSLQNECQSPKR